MVESFGMGPRRAGFVPGQYLMQGIMQNDDKNWAESLSSSVCKGSVYTSCVIPLPSPLFWCWKLSS